MESMNITKLLVIRYSHNAIFFPHTSAYLNFFCLESPSICYSHGQLLFILQDSPQPSCPVGGTSLLLPTYPYAHMYL